MLLRMLLLLLLAYLLLLGRLLWRAQLPLLLPVPWLLPRRLLLLGWGLLLDPILRRCLRLPTLPRGAPTVTCFCSKALAATDSEHAHTCPNPNALCVLCHDELVGGCVLRDASGWGHILQRAAPRRAAVRPPYSPTPCQSSGRHPLRAHKRARRGGCVRRSPGIPATQSQSGTHRAKHKAT
jgi:hypothetical protein